MSWANKQIIDIETSATERSINGLIILVQDHINTVEKEFPQSSELNTSLDASLKLRDLCAAISKRYLRISQGRHNLSQSKA